LPPRILICDRIHEDCLKMLRENGFLVDYFPKIKHEELLKVVGEYECLVVRSRTKVTSEVLNNAGKLRLIVRAGSGLDNIDQDAARIRGIKLIRCPEAVAPPVAELTIWLMISLARGLNKLAYSTRARLPSKSETIGHELLGKKLGVVGVGAVGSRVAKIAHGFGMKLLLNDIRPIDPRDYGGSEVVDLETLLKAADFITLHIPLTEGTRSMLDERRLSIMKRTAYLINTSRPEIVDSKALYIALKEGWIAGAAFEVTEEWLRENPEFLELDNFICTPHIGSQTEESLRRVSISVAEKIIKEFEAPKPTSKTSQRSPRR